MTKAKSKSNRTNKPSHLQLATLAIAIGAFLLALFAASAAHIAYQESSDALYQQKHTQELEKLRFCYNNHLTTCSPESIEDWNEKNPDNTFNQ